MMRESVPGGNTSHSVAQQPKVACFGRQYDGVLFDMDGTLVDSRAVVERIWAAWARPNELDLGKILAASHGRRTIDTVREFAAPGMDVESEAEKLEAMESEDHEGVVAVPGALDFINQLSDDQWAIVTSAGRLLAEKRLRAAGFPIPRLMVTAEDVSRGKPDPQGYEIAAKLLGKATSQCVVFEDAPAGIEAGIRAGCEVVAIRAAQPFAFEPPCRAISDFRSEAISVTLAL